MNKFGELNGVTASSLLLLESASVDFLKACNKAIDELNLKSMSSELVYMQAISQNIKDILKTKPEFNINDEADNEKILNEVISALCVIIKDKTGIEIELESTDLFGEEDILSDLFDMDNISNEEFDSEDFDLFGDSEFETSVESEGFKESFTLENILSFSKTPECINESLGISSRCINSLLDELYLVQDKYSVFETRCKFDPDLPVNESRGIKKIVESGRGNVDIIDAIEKSYSQISLFHLSFNDIKNLLQELNEMHLLTSSTTQEIDTSMYSDKTIMIGDYIAYFIYTNMHKTSFSYGDKELIEYLINLCEAKASRSSSKSRVFNMPLNLCYLKFKGTNYQEFCRSLETLVDSIPGGDFDKYFKVIKSISDSLLLIKNYIETVSFNPKGDEEFEQFKDYLCQCVVRGKVLEGYSSDVESFVKELKNKKLLISESRLREYNENLDIASEMYSSEIYDTYKLYSLASKFSTDEYNALLPPDVIDNFGVIDISILIEVDKYLKDIYRIIPLTVSNYVKSKVLATSKTNKVVNKNIYNSIKPSLDLVIENFESKYSVKDRPTSGVMIIS